MGCLATDKRVVMTANEVALGSQTDVGPPTEVGLLCLCIRTMVRSFVTGALARLQLTSSSGPPCVAATAIMRIGGTFPVAPAA